MMPRGSRIVVTGGAGFIGSHLCDALLARGHEVQCVDTLVGSGGTTRNVDHLLSDRRFSLVVDDVRDWAPRADLVGVEAVFHLAASKNSVSLADPELDLDVNALGTLRVAHAAARGGVRKLVHSSTGSVIGETPETHEDASPTRPVSYYGVSKLAGESYVRVIGDLSGTDTTVLRYYHVIGPRQDDSERGGVLPIFVRRGLAGQPLVIDGDGGQTRSFTSVHDAVRANLIAFQRPETRGRTFHCASSLRVSITSLAEEVLALTGSRAGLDYGPPRPGDIRHFAVDNAPLRSLGLTFDRDWRRMVADVVEAMTGRSVAA
jgi:UDP-glucose 4-epimerase